MKRIFPSLPSAGFFHCCLILAATVMLAPASAAGALKVNGSTTVNLPVAEAAEILRAEKGMQIQMDTQGGSSGGVSLLGEGQVQVGMSSKPLHAEDRAKYPGVRFNEIHIGEDAVALIVSKDVWEGGVKALSREQVQGIYEGKLTNWKELGGPDRRIVFFNKEPGRGTWEVFADWAYGSHRKAPAVSFREVGGNEEARSKVGSTHGALSQLSASWADGKTIFALGIRQEDGTVIHPTKQEIAARRYPMSRPLFLLTNGEPTAEAAILVEFLLGTRGQEIVRKHGYLPLADLKPAGPDATR